MALEDDIKQYAILAREALLRKYSHAKTGIVKGLNDKGRITIEVDGQEITVKYNGSVYPTPGDKVIYNPETKKVLVEGYTKKKRKKTTALDLIVRDKQRIAQIKKEDASASNAIRKRKTLDSYLADDGARIPFIILEPVKKPLEGLKFFIITDNQSNRTSNRTVTFSSGSSSLSVNYPADPSPIGDLNIAHLVLTEEPLTDTAFNLAVPYDDEVFQDMNSYLDARYEWGPNIHPRDFVSPLSTQLTATYSPLDFDVPLGYSFDVCISGSPLPPRTWDHRFIFGSYNPLLKALIYEQAGPFWDTYSDPSRFFPWSLDGGDCFSNYTYLPGFQLPNYVPFTWYWSSSYDNFYLNDVINVLLKQESPTAEVLVYELNSQLVFGPYNYEAFGRRMTISGTGDNTLSGSFWSSLTPLAGPSIEDHLSSEGYYQDISISSNLLNFTELNIDGKDQQLIFEKVEAKYKTFDMNVVYGYYYPEEDGYLTLQFLATSPDSTYTLQWSLFP